MSTVAPARPRTVASCLPPLEGHLGEIRAKLEEAANLKVLPPCREGGEDADPVGVDESRAEAPVDWERVEAVWSWIIPALREAIEAICTRKQIRALKLRAFGLTEAATARAEGVSQSAISQRMTTVRANLKGLPPYVGEGEQADPVGIDEDHAMTPEQSAAAALNEFRDLLASVLPR